jgi:hypothetical protein
MVVAAALAIFTVWANAAQQVNDTDEINLVIFVPCADGGAGENVDLSGPLHTLITFTISKRNVSGVAHYSAAGYLRCRRNHWGHLSRDWRNEG